MQGKQLTETFITRDKQSQAIGPIVTHYINCKIMDSEIGRIQTEKWKAQRGRMTGTQKLKG